MNVLAASSLLDAYSVPSVAFVTYSDSLAEAPLFHFLSALSKNLGYIFFSGFLLYRWI
jgi:hypothetical protein